MKQAVQFNKRELAGSLGDLGTLLPLAFGMVLVNGLHVTGLFFVVGLFYVVAGLYFGLTVPVQPMKVIGAYSVAMGLSASQIQASGLWMGLFLMVLGVSGAITLIGRLIPKGVVRGVQLSTGALLIAQGVRFMAGTSKFQAMQGLAEPYLQHQSLGPVPIGLVIGVAGCILTFFLIESRVLPAGLAIVLGGIGLGILLGSNGDLTLGDFGFHLPPLLPFGLPTREDLSFALLVLVLPQIPMTLGNAVVAYADLSRNYFGAASNRVTYRAACISMALANLFSALVGGMPLCHGAGGLAAHYRFGARTAGSNIMIGAIFLLLSLLLGRRLLSLIYLIPLSVLGVLLLFAGAQLALTIIDLKERKELFVALLMLGITLASNLAIAFGAGIIASHLLRWSRMKV